MIFMQKEKYIREKIRVYETTVDRCFKKMQTLPVGSEEYQVWKYDWSYYNGRLDALKWVLNEL